LRITKPAKMSAARELRQFVLRAFQRRRMILDDFELARFDRYEIDVPGAGPPRVEVPLRILPLLGGDA
jgi:hypothetical protein